MPGVKSNVEAVGVGIVMLKMIFPRLLVAKLPSCQEAVIEMGGCGNGRSQDYTI